MMTVALPVGMPDLSILCVCRIFLVCSVADNAWRSTLPANQVLMHEATWQSLIDNINYCKEEKAVFSNMGKHNLKGISKMVYITQVCLGPLC